MKVNYKLYALGMMAILVVLVVLALMSFAGGFESTKLVTVRSDRVGLVMEPSGKVKMRGVQVGKVAAIKQDSRGALLELEIDSAQMSKIPTNVDVDIRSSTVFGAKYVNFMEPDNPSADHISDGATIEAKNVTVEFNTLFENLQTVLRTVQPEKINATLGAISTALNGQGEDLGNTLSQANEYLAEVNPTLPALAYDMQQAALATDSYAQLAPDLMTMLDNATSIGETVVDESQNLNQTLVNAIAMASSGQSVLDAAGEDFVTTMDVFAPTFGLVEEYSPVLTCFIVGVSNAKDTGEKAFGGQQPGLNLTSTFLAGAPSYQYPDNLPKVNAKNPPNCYGLPWRDENTNAPYVVTDTGVNPTVTEDQQVNPQSLWAFLIGPPPPGWTW